MTRENLVTVRDNVRQDEAKRLLHQHRIEKLLVVDDNQCCVGLITVKDMEKAQLNRMPLKMSKDAFLLVQQQALVKTVCAVQKL